MRAAQRGLVHYTPVKPCKRCGTLLRYTSNGCCCYCTKQRAIKAADKLKRARKGGE